MNKKIKAVLIGDSSVGKTCIALRAAKNEFHKDIAQTVGGSYFDLQIQTNDGPVHFNIWDTAGQEQYKTLVPMFFQNAALALIVFDLTSRQTFDNLKDWVELLERRAPENIIKVLVGNKVDLLETQQRQISFQSALDYSQEIDASMYVETSALTGQGVLSLFEELAKKKELIPKQDEVPEPEPIESEERPGWCGC